MTRTACAFALSLGLLVCAENGVFLAAAIDKIPVTASFRCTASQPPAFETPNPTTPCTNLDRMAGDEQDAYVGVPTSPKTLPQNTYITTGGTFWFAQQSGSGRSVFFDLSEPLLPLQPPLLRAFTTAWSTSFQPNWLAAPIGVSNGLWGMRLGQPVEGTLKANFQNAYDTYRWTIRFNADAYPSSTNLSITCTSVDGSNNCNGWTIEATADHRAQLEAATTKGKSVVYDEGTYRMPFALDISYP
jgi:hypothetical protein